MPRSHRSTSTGWGGARRNAGRPRSRSIASEPHKTRPALSSRHPVLVVARLTSTLGSIGRRRASRAVDRAVSTSLARADFRVIHVVVTRRRLQLVVEADDKVALARGMQGFQIAAARRLNGLLRRSGTVFPDRYRARALRTRAAVRAAVASLATSALFAVTAAWPATWLLRVELAATRSSSGSRAGPQLP